MNSTNLVVANAIAATNSIACNAKFKIGDKVKWNFGGGVMTVVDKNGTDYLCRDSKGQEVVYSEDKLIAANAVAANASESSYVKVTMTTISFSQGKKEETRNLKLSDFMTLLRKLGLESEDRIMRDISAGGADVAIDSDMTAIAI